MRHRIIAALTFAALAAPARAQVAAPSTPADQSASAVGAPLRSFDERAEADAHWREKLGLTVPQAQKLAEAERVKEDALRPLRSQLRDALVKLQEQVVGKAPESEIQATLERVAKVRASMQGVDKRYDEQLALFLSPTQRARILLGAPVGAIKTEPAAGREGQSGQATEPEEEKE
jgi:Spy/CpxP family protein refolding chaperone